MYHILVVDDETDVREFLEFVLQSEGYAVTTAANGRDAIKQFHKHLPDLILLDLMMPDVDGMEICWRIRAFSSIPIIMLTAKDKELEIVYGFEAGADDYITKPFNTEVLLARVKALLRRFHKLQEQKFPSNQIGKV